MRRVYERARVAARCMLLRHKTDVCVCAPRVSHAVRARSIAIFRARTEINVNPHACARYIRARVCMWFCVHWGLFVVWFVGLGDETVVLEPLCAVWCCGAAAVRARALVV